MPETSWPGALTGPAYSGLAGKIVRTIEPHTEADPAALLVQLLVAFGNAVGSGPHFMVEATAHRMNLFAVIVGQTAKARKGTSWDHINALFAKADEAILIEGAERWQNRLANGLTSGEGLIWRVRDPSESLERLRKDDAGIADKRLLVVTAEFGSTLRVIRRPENTLSPTLRDLWDGREVQQVLNKNNPVRSTEPHVSVVGHITWSELKRHLDDHDIENGFANRFLWCCARRSKHLPHGGSLPSSELDRLIASLANALKFAGGAAVMTRSADARRLWEQEYPRLSADHEGLFGDAVARAEAQVVRLACIYALLDCSAVVRRHHLLSALAVWHYCESSARFIFGDKLRNPIADKILTALKSEPAGLTQSQIVHAVLGGNHNAERVQAALTLLKDRQLACCRTSPDTGGRPSTRWVAQ